MVRTQGNGEVHTEAAVATFNGFVMLAIGIALLVMRELARLRRRDRASLRRRALGKFAWALAAFIAGGLRARRPLHAAAERGGDPAALRRLPGHERARRGCAGRIRSTRARRSRCARATSTASGSRSTTSAATRSRSPRSSSGASTTRRRRVRRRRLRALRQAAERGRGAPPRVVVRLRRRRHGAPADRASRRCSRAPTSSPRRSSRELQARLEQAGVVVDEARLTHLAYAPEIAQVMLRRQQAEAIIAARTKIVTGAVSMVEMALTSCRRRRSSSSTTSARRPWSTT